MVLARTGILAARTRAAVTGARQAAQVNVGA
jgi:hypothetical protein